MSDWFADDAFLVNQILWGGFQDRAINPRQGDSTEPPQVSKVGIGFPPDIPTRCPVHLCAEIVLDTGGRVAWEQEERAGAF